MVPAGRSILEQDDDPVDVCFIEDGVVELTRRGPDGTSFVVGLRFPGWFLGAEAAIVGDFQPASAVAVTPCAIHRIPRQTFLHLLKTDADVSWRINQMHGREVFDQLLRSAGRTRSPLMRLKIFLTQIIKANAATPLDKQITLRLPVGDDELAQLIAVPAREIPRLFARLQREQYLRVVEHTVVALNPRRLMQAHLKDVGWPINVQPGRQRGPTGTRGSIVKPRDDYHERA